MSTTQPASLHRGHLSLCAAPGLPLPVGRADWNSRAEAAGTGGGRAPAKTHQIIPHMVLHAHTVYMLKFFVVKFHTSDDDPIFVCLVVALAGGGCGQGAAVPVAGAVRGAVRRRRSTHHVFIIIIKIN